MATPKDKTKQEIAIRPVHQVDQFTEEKRQLTTLNLRLKNIIERAQAKNTHLEDEVKVFFFLFFLFYLSLLI